MNTFKHFDVLKLIKNVIYKYQINQTKYTYSLIKMTIWTSLYILVFHHGVTVRNWQPQFVSDVGRTGRTFQHNGNIPTPTVLFHASSSHVYHDFSLFLKKIAYLFVLAAGSPLLHRLSLLGEEWGLLCSCGMRESHCSGFFRAQGLQQWAQQLQILGSRAQAQ